MRTVISPAIFCLLCCQPDRHSGTFAWRGQNLVPGAEQAGTLRNPNESQTSFRRFAIGGARHAFSVILDRNRDRALIAPNLDAGARSFRMSDDVVDRLLHDAIEVDLALLRKHSVDAL